MIVIKPTQIRKEIKNIKLENRNRLLFCLERYKMNHGMYRLATDSGNINYTVSHPLSKQLCLACCNPKILTGSRNTSDNVTT